MNESTNTNNLTSIHYDSAGAASFIIVVLFCYSISMVCMLIMQIRAHSKTIEDCARRRAKLFIETLRDQTQTKQILEELIDKQKRDKLWSIYLSKMNKSADELKCAEICRIRNIKKQLAHIKRNHTMINDILLYPVENHYIHRMLSDSRPISTTKLSSVDKQIPIRRRSSFDQQKIERWKSFMDQNKSHEQVPWTIKKVLLHRYFRQHHKNSPIPLEPINRTLNNFSLTHSYLETIDAEQYCLLLSHKQIHNNLHRIMRKTNEPLNPYITYFHLPINENFKPSIQNLPLTTNESDYHVIEMNCDQSQH